MAKLAGALALFWLLVAWWYSDVGSGEEVSCIGDDGSYVDWFAIYKLPRGQIASGRNGQEYLYISNVTASQGWRLSEGGSVNAPTSALFRTLRQLNSAAALLSYNDELPGKDGRSTAYWAHAKGTLALDTAGKGLWVVHSIPKFPAIVNGSLDNKTALVPEAELLYGQIALCTSLDVPGIETAGNQLLYIRPQIYARVDRSKGAALKGLSTRVQSLWEKRPKWVRKEPWWHAAPLTTRGGRTLMQAFAKSGKQGGDFYADILGPGLKAELLAATWQRGAGQPLPSVCQGIAFPVLNVRDVSAASASWASLVDHSKWAVTAGNQTSWACIADLNRMQSQARRGGGALCIQSGPVWKSFYDIVKDVEPCLINSTKSSINEQHPT